MKDVNDYLLFSLWQPNESDRSDAELVVNETTA